MVGGLDQPSRGQVTINNAEISKMRSDELSWLRCKTVGYVFQSFNLIDILTALENVSLPMTFVGMDPEEANDKAARILEKVGLGHRLHHLPDAVSGGQRQRIAIARALANDPAIILADEPTGNLDIHTGEEIIKLLKKLTEESGTTVVTVTHDMKMFDISDRIVWIRDGAIERIAKRSELSIRIGGVS
jgi:putative ABC transport system ATP-binding protein